MSSEPILKVLDMFKPTYKYNFLNIYSRIDVNAIKKLEFGEKIQFDQLNCYQKFATTYSLYKCDFCGSGNIGWYCITFDMFQITEKGSTRSKFQLCDTKKISCLQPISSIKQLIDKYVILICAYNDKQNDSIVNIIDYDIIYNIVSKVSNINDLIIPKGDI